MNENKRKVLIVDDELDALQDHIGELEQADFEVTPYRTTDEALRRFLDGDVSGFDIIVLDMMIPPPHENPEPIDVWDGLRSGGHLLGILRGRSRSTVPVLLLSNLAEEEIELEAWDRFEEWQAERGHPVPDANSSEAVRSILKEHFRTWIRAKRRTPPWHFPRLLEDILAVRVPST